MPVVVLILNLPFLEFAVEFDALLRAFRLDSEVAWALQKEETRLARNHARTKLGRLEAKRDAAHDRERG
jgi:hypothetical protein